ncbi:MAG: TetR/AcrR family transcriptional regulator [Lewinella sp.]|nr:TetR/AcrR family transcriptional regulator [Lewinella sp.]
MLKTKKGEQELSTEERIKEAAKKLFTQKGFEATKTRDIAEASGINLALLNYYFRSKKKLFELVMKENIQLFLGVIVEHFENKNLSFEEKVAFVADHYIDMLLENPDLPSFVQQHIKTRPAPGEEAKGPAAQKIQLIRKYFIEDFEAGVKKGIYKDVHPMHVMANLMGLIIWPFTSTTMLMAKAGISNRKEFEKLMHQRKKMIPIWIKAMFEK